MARKRKKSAPKSDRQATQRARSDRRRKKSPMAQASHFVHEELHHEKAGKHDRPKNRKQAIAIGLSKARRHGVKVPKKKRS